jgi:hypothetical protein
LIVLAGAGLLLAGCTNGPRTAASPAPVMGEAVKWNSAVQTIDPNPVYSDQDAQPGSSGAKGAEAVKRYRTDAVKDVSVMTTTSDSGSSEPR